MLTDDENELEDDSPWIENDPEDLELIQLVIGANDAEYNDGQQILLSKDIHDEGDEAISIKEFSGTKRKGSTHQNYAKCSDRVDAIYHGFMNNNYRPKFADISKMYGFRESTIRGWYTRYQSDPTWRPYHNHYSGINRLFTDEQEQSIANYLVENYISRNIGITLRQLRKVLLVFYNEFLLNDIDELENPDDFDYESVRAMAGSRGMLFSFMKRTGLSFRKLRAMRRPDINPNEVAIYQAALRRVRGLSTLHILVNVDESNWLVVQAPKKIIALRGAESVKCLILGDPKAGFSFAGTICDSGLKLPIYAIARGKTESCHK
jgi:hypothetical protein